MPAEQVGRRRDVGPAGQFPDGGGARAAAAERRRGRVEHGRAVDREPGRAGVAQQHPVARVQRQRVAEAETGVDRRGSRAVGGRAVEAFPVAPGRPAGRSQDAESGVGAGGTDVQQEFGRELGLRVGRGRGYPDVELGRQRPPTRLDEGHAAGREVGPDAPEVERHPGDAGHLVGGLPQGLQTADPDRLR